jgi:hypothetical protein
MKKLKCVVAATNSNGSPDFYPVIVECTEDDIEHGRHYDVAKDAAADAGYEPYLVYDEEEMPLNERLMTLFGWNEVTTVKCEKKI